MVYRVNFHDPSTAPIDVQDSTLNTETHLTFVGKNWFGYGETIAENQLRLLENFAHRATGPQDTHPDPTKAVEGQIYYNKDTENFYYFYMSPTNPNDPAYTGTGNDRIKEWRFLPGSSLKTVEVVDTQGVKHSINIGVDYDNATSANKIVYAMSSSSTANVNYIDLDANNTENTAEILAAFPKGIGKGIQMACNDLDYKFHGTATSAQYADLAEMYSSDAEYEPGTVVKIGGEAEVTQTTTAFDPGVFGIVSTDPAYLMNSALEGTSVPVALAGRVPVKVIGPVKKGQRLLSSEEPGVARAATDYEMQEYMDWYRIVGRALEDKTTEGIGLVEVVVGAK